MESVAAFEPLLWTALGGESRTGCDAGLNPYTIQGSGPNTWTLAPQGTPLWRTTWYNFAPRLGAAYILHDAPGRETVVRGGGGVFFDTGQQLGSLGFNGPGFCAINSLRRRIVSSAWVVPAIVNPPAGPYAQVYSFAPHLQLPYTLQWNASIEQALGKSQALTVSYVGSHASRLLQENYVSTRQQPKCQLSLLRRERPDIGLRLVADSIPAETEPRVDGSGVLHVVPLFRLRFRRTTIGYQRGNCDFDVTAQFFGCFLL